MSPAASRSRMARRAFWLSSPMTLKLRTQRDSSSGMGVLFIHPPHANWKKSSHGPPALSSAWAPAPGSVVSWARAGAVGAGGAVDEATAGAGASGGGASPPQAKANEATTGRAVKTTRGRRARRMAAPYGSKRAVRHASSARSLRGRDRTGSGLRGEGRALDASALAGGVVEIGRLRAHGLHVGCLRQKVGVQRDVERLAADGPVAVAAKVVEELPPEALMGVLAGHERHLLALPARQPHVLRLGVAREAH